jgi:hypothetical protein
MKKERAADGRPLLDVLTGGLRPPDGRYRPRPLGGLATRYALAHSVQTTNPP